MVFKIYDRETSQQFIEYPDSIIIDTNKNIIAGFNGDDALFAYPLDGNIRVDIEN